MVYEVEDASITNNERFLINTVSGDPKKPLKFSTDL